MMAVPVRPAATTRSPSWTGRVTLQLIVLYRHRRVPVQQVNPGAVGRQGNIDELGDVLEIQHNHEWLQCAIDGAAPLVVDDDLPAFVDAIAVG